MSSSLLEVLEYWNCLGQQFTKYEFIEIISSAKYEQFL